MNQYRTFNTIEEAVETWRREAEKGINYSGVLCQCFCSHYSDAEMRKLPRYQNFCMVLLPSEVYKEYEDCQKEAEKYGFKKQTILLGPGRITVKFHPDEKYNKDILTPCEYRDNIKTLLLRQIGNKIRLGKNLLVKKRKKR